MLPAIQNIKDSVVVHQADLKKLRDIMIDLHYQDEKINPYLIAICVSILTIAGQWLIFQLTKKKDLRIWKINTAKEINIEVAKLFGKTKARGLTYINIFYRYNDSEIKYTYFVFLTDYYAGLINDEEHRGSITEEETEDLFDKHTTAKEKMKVFEEKVSTQFLEFKAEKIALFEVLHETSFYYNDPTLNQQIHDLQNVFTVKWDVKKYSEELSDSAYLRNYTQRNIVPITTKIQTDLETITSRIRTVATS